MTYRKQRYVARWQTLPGGFHDEPTPQAAVAFAIEQAAFNTRGTSWTVTDEFSGEIIASGYA